MKRNFPPESFQIRAALSQSLRQLWSGKNHLIKIYPRASAKTIVVSLRTECIEQKMERNLSESFRLLLIATRGYVPRWSCKIWISNFFFQFSRVKGKTFFYYTFHAIDKRNDKG